MKIAICDDEEMFLKYIEKLIFVKCNYEIFAFNNPVDLLSSYKQNKFDCVLLDIDMPILDGFETAKILKNIDEKIEIIFITCKDEFVFSCFEYRPFNFIRKSKIEKELNSLLSKVEKSIFGKKPKIILVKANNNIVKINSLDIFYIESIGNYVEINGDNYLIAKYKDTLKNILCILSKEFIRSHSGFIINMSHIKVIEKKSIILENNIQLPLSRNRLKEVKQIYQKYLLGE